MVTFKIWALRFTEKDTNPAQSKAQSTDKGKTFLMYMHHDIESNEKSSKFGESMDVSCQLEARDGLPRDAGG